MAATERPDGLLAQYKLLGAVIDADWATGLDHKVARHVIDRHYSKYGNSRASLRYLEEATGARRPNVIASLRRLTDHAVIAVIRQGAGTRPTEYSLNFNFGASGNVGDTAKAVSPSGIVDDTACGTAGDTSSASSGIAGDTETYLLSTAYNAGRQVSRNLDPHAAPTAPLAPPAYAADAAGTARVPFDEFWDVYPRKHQKPKARAAYAALNPGPELHSRIVDAARLLAQHYEEHAVEKKHQPFPANWLAGERYDEDLPAVFGDPRAEALKRKKVRQNGEASLSVSSSKSAGLFPPGVHRLRIAAAEEVGSVFGTEWAVDLTLLGVDHPIEGVEFKRRLEILSNDGEGQVDGAGRDAYEELSRLTGEHCPVSFLPGKIVGAHNMSDGGIYFTPDPAGTRLVEIDKSDIVVDGLERWIRIELAEPWDDESDVGPISTGRIDILYESQHSRLQGEGQDRLRKLLDAIGLKHMTDTDQLDFCRFTLGEEGEFLPVLAPAPVPANDDVSPPKPHRKKISFLETVERIPMPTDPWPEGFRAQARSGQDAGDDEVAA